MSDSLLLQFFKSYLEVNRPHGITPTQHRAKKTPDASRRQQLKELGMFRLLRGNNAHATHEAFGRYLQLKKVDAWYRARPNSEKIIESESAEIRSLLSQKFPFLDLPQNGK